jgi:hypothetical protein
MQVPRSEKSRNLVRVSAPITSALRYIPERRYESAIE